MADAPSDSSPEIFKLYHYRDWGDVDIQDGHMNYNGIFTGGRLVSIYKSVRGQRFYIITEGDRSTTTVLLPENY